MRNVARWLWSIFAGDHEEERELGPPRPLAIPRPQPQQAGVQAPPTLHPRACARLPGPAVRAHRHPGPRRGCEQPLAVSRRTPAAHPASGGVFPPPLGSLGDPRSCALRRLAQGAPPPPPPLLAGNTRPRGVPAFPNPRLTRTFSNAPGRGPWQGQREGSGSWFNYVLICSEGVFVFILFTSVSKNVLKRKKAAGERARGVERGRKG